MEHKRWRLSHNMKLSSFKMTKSTALQATICHFEALQQQFTFTFIISATLLIISLRNSPLFPRRQRVIQVWNDTRASKWLIIIIYFFFKWIVLLKLFIGEHLEMILILYIFKVITRYHGSRVWIKSQKDIHCPHCTGRCCTFIRSHFICFAWSTWKAMLIKMWWNVCFCRIWIEI